MKNIKAILIMVIAVFQTEGQAKIKNLGQPFQNIYRGAWLSGNESNFLELKAKEVKTIINLHFSRNDQKLCTKYKINCVHKPIVILPFIDLLQSELPFIKAYWTARSYLEKGETIYIHCLQGSDRTGLLISAFNIEKHVCHGKGIVTEKDRKKIIFELYKHKYHSFFFPGIESKILRWLKEKPRWLCKRPWK